MAHFFLQAGRAPIPLLEVSTLALALSLAPACSSLGPSAAEGESPFASDADFVAVARSSSEATQTKAQSLRLMAVPDATGNESFYLAVSKRALAQKYFLTAYLSQLSPAGIDGGAASSLGTRVVTFRQQNGKLFVFDAGDGHATSDVFDPELVIDAYPIVDPASVKGLKGASDYVLVDPAAGLNRFGFLGDYFAADPNGVFTVDPAAPVQFNVDLAFLQRFRGIADGAVFDEVFSGTADVPVGGEGVGEKNPLRASGTLTLALRRYAEGKGFAPAPEVTAEHYFRDDARREKNTGVVYAPINKWNIKKGMKPIKWVVGADALATLGDVVGPEYDLWGAVKAGIESWNDAFGFKVFDVGTATSKVSFGDDDVNYLIVDPDPSLGYAFANWRSNPNTGEIRGASVYFGGAWFDPSYFSDDPAVAARSKAPSSRPKVPALTWSSLQDRPHCALYAGDIARAAGAAAAAAPGAAKLTQKQKFEHFLSHVVAHEVGHTLGLRHNFAGSLVADGQLATSIMDYLADDDAVVLPGPGSYDTDAVRFLYGLSATEPTAAFCTDEDTVVDPMCNVFDRSDDPLKKDFSVRYAAWVDVALAGGVAPVAPYLDRWMNRVAQFARAGTADQQKAAVAALFAKVGAPAAAAVTSKPVAKVAADDLARMVASRLYLDGPELRGDFTADPGKDAAAPLAVQLKSILVNADAIRSFPARRVAVDALKKRQDTAGYDALVDARATIAKARLALTGEAARLTDDLLSRIDEATHPYFK